jgi:hypothetical protein
MTVFVGENPAGIADFWRENPAVTGALLLDIRFRLRELHRSDFSVLAIC